MRRDLEHLPPAKQREIERVVQIIFEEFTDAMVLATQDWKRKAHIAKIILYGSFARGTWVDEPHTAKGYISDYDLLIIVSDKRITDRAAYWSKLEDRLNTELAFTRTLHTPVNFILHTMNEVNEGLAQGRYFFVDAVKDGVALYESQEGGFHRPKPKTPEQALKLAQEYFDEWYPSAIKRLNIAKFDISQEYLKDAAFDLHQATERLYNCALLVLTSYSPHTHNIKLLRTHAEGLDRRFIDAWPRDERHHRALFEKLKESYVKARYSKHYTIEPEALDWLGERVEELARITHTVCAERLAHLHAQVG